MSLVSAPASKNDYIAYIPVVKTFPTLDDLNNALQKASLNGITIQVLNEYSAVFYEPKEVTSKYVMEIKEK